MKLFTLITLSALAAIACSITTQDDQMEQVQEVPSILQDGIAFKDVSARIQQAAKDVKHESDKVDLKPAKEWLAQAERDSKSMLDKINSESFSTWLEQVGKSVNTEMAKVNLEDLPAEILQYIKDNPAQTAFYVANGVVIFAPGLLYGPLLGLLGFGVDGPVAGTIATFLQSKLGGIVAKRGLFAYTQSAGMNGYGVGLVNGITRGCSMVAAIAERWRGTAPEPSVGSQKQED